MSLPGWYPDPAGTPNRFRYWDGRAWSSDTTDNPAAAPAGAGVPSGPGDSGGAGSPPTQEGRRRFGPLILVLAALVVLVLVGVLVVRGLFADRPIVDPGPLPSSTVSGWDDSSPTTEPETPTPTPSVSQPTPSPTATPTPHRGAAAAALSGGPTHSSAGPSQPTAGSTGVGSRTPEVEGWDDTSGIVVQLGVRRG